MVKNIRRVHCVRRYHIAQFLIDFRIRGVLGVRNRVLYFIDSATYLDVPILSYRVVHTEKQVGDKVFVRHGWDAQ